MNPEMNVQKNSDSGSYEAVVNGQVVGMIVYHAPRGYQRVTLTHTIVGPEYRAEGSRPGLSNTPWTIYERKT